MTTDAVNISDGADLTKVGVKFDGNKLRWDLIPVFPLELLLRLYTEGAAKYDARNWEKGMRFGKLFAAMMRHATLWWGGEIYDKKDEWQHHLAAVAWNALALIELERTHAECDDRIPQNYVYNENTNPITRELTKFVKTLSDDDKRKMLADDDLSPTMLKLFAESDNPSENLLNGIVCHHKTPIDVLQTLSKIGNDRIKNLILCDRDLPEELLRIFMPDKNPVFRRRVIDHKKVTISILYEMINDKDKHVRGFARTKLKVMVDKL